MKNYVIIIKQDTEFAYIPKHYFVDLLKTNSKWNLLNKHNNEKISFIYNVQIKYYYNINTEISNLFDSKHLKYITNKSNLFHTVNKYLPETYKKYMMYHTDVDINKLDEYKEIFIDDKIFILRPTWGFARYGIQLFSDFNKFKDFMLSTGKKELNNESEFKKRTNKNNKFVYVLSEYLQHQLLIQNKIFNFRVFYLVSLINNKYRSYLLMPFVIHLANKERTSVNLDLSEAISSYVGTTDKIDLYQDNIKFNDLINEFGKNNTELMTNQIKHILSKLFKLIKYKHIFVNYPKTSNSYEIFGLDFIANDKFNIKLIEFNDQVGINPKYPENLYRTLSSGIINATINKLYDKEYHIKIDKDIKKNIIRIHSNKNYL